MDLLDPKASPNGTYVSTGALPPVEQVRALVAEAHERFATVGQGQVWGEGIRARTDTNSCKLSLKFPQDGSGAWLISR